MKKWLIVAVIFCFAIMMAGCSNKNEYVKLGDYKGLEVTATSTEVTDEEVDAQIQLLLEDKATTQDVSGRPVQEGDVVNIDFEGQIDGEIFDGGSATDYDLTIGSDLFIEGFEDGLVGANIGETRSLELSFPDPYDNNPDLAGKPVVFAVTINGIQESVTPELNDAFVQSLGEEYQTVDDYKTALRSSLEEQKKQVAESEKISALRDMLYQNCEIIKYPDGSLDAYVQEMTDYYKNYAASVELTLDEYMQQNYGITEAEFNEQAQQTAEQNVGMELIMEAIAQKEKITIDDEEYKELCTQYTQDFGFESEEQFIDYYGGEENVRKNMLSDKVMEFVSDNAVEVSA